MVTTPKALDSQQRHRDKRRAAGKCGYHGCSRRSGARYYCTEHRAQHAKAQKRWRKAGA